MHSRKHALPTLAATLTLLALLLVAGGSHDRGEALPEFSRRYDVPCQTCHTVAPQLNQFGLAFQANHFNWPGGRPPAYHTGLSALPLSGIATLSRLGSAPDEGTQSDLRAVELYASGGLPLGPSRSGGYFVDYFAATRGDDGHAGDLESAFAAVPLAGRRGQWALTAGQFSPLMYQYDPVNSLSATLPAALDTPVDDLAFDAASPGVRLDFFNNRGRRVADGDYLSVGVPFEGELALRSTSRLYGPHGVYAHAFRRWGYATFGAFGYAHSGSNLGGLIGTYALSRNLRLLGIGATGQDADGSHAPPLAPGRVHAHAVPGPDGPGGLARRLHRLHLPRRRPHLLPVQRAADCADRRDRPAAGKPLDHPVRPGAVLTRKTR